MSDVSGGTISERHGERRSSRPPPHARGGATKSRKPALPSRAAAPALPTSAIIEAPREAAREAWAFEKPARALEMPSASEFPTAAPPRPSDAGAGPVLPMAPIPTPPPMPVFKLPKPDAPPPAKSDAALRPAPIVILASDEPLLALEPPPPADVACSMCATINRSHLRYCQSCGMSLAKTASTAAPPPAPVPVAAVPAPPTAPAAALSSRLHPASDPAAPARDEIAARFEPARFDRASTHEEIALDQAPAPWPSDAFEDSADAGEDLVAIPGPGSRRRWKIRIAVLVVLVAGEMGLAYRTGALRAWTSPAAQPSVATLSAAPTAVPPVAAALVAPIAPAVAKPSIPADMGLLKTADALPGHRIYVDEHTVGQTPHAVLVRCGKVSVKIGHAGRARPIDIPCGNEISVGQ